MKKFLELLDSMYIDYEIQDGAVVVQEQLAIDELGDVEQISIPENTDFEFGLICNDSDIEIQLPENLNVGHILKMFHTAKIAVELDEQYLHFGQTMIF